MSDEAVRAPRWFVDLTGLSRKAKERAMRDCVPGVFYKLSDSLLWYESPYLPPTKPCASSTTSGS